VEIFFQNKSYGIAGVVSPHVNAKIGRNWDPKSAPTQSQKSEDILAPPPGPSTGQLFGGGGDV
jgi:hypothetical protein